MTPYTYAEWKKVRVHIDYHVEVDRHYYSVPYQLVKKQLDARVSEHTVECFYKSTRVASHVRSLCKGGHTTVREHMPKSHQQYGDWAPQRLLHWAEKSGPATARVITTVLTARAHPQQSIMSHHTTAEDAGRVAQAAGVKMLVLSHLVPPDDPAITDDMWIDAARVHYRGTVIVGKDLLEI